MGQERECLLVAPVLSLFGGSVGEQGGLRAGPQPAEGTEDLSGTNWPSETRMYYRDHILKKKKTLKFLKQQF